MRSLVLMLAVCLCGAVPMPSLGQTPPVLSAGSPNTVEALQAFFADEWERTLRESPETASYAGDTRYDDRWSDLSLEAIARREAADRDALGRLQAIGRAGLPPERQPHYDSYEWQLRRKVERQKFREYLQPIDHQGGPQTADGIAETMPFATTADYRRFLARMAAVPALIDQVIALMREGVKTGNLPPKVTMRRVPAQIDLQIVDDPARSPFHRPFKSFGAGIAEADRAALLEEAGATIRDRIVPAYRKLQRYFVGDYLPNTRESIAAADGPSGAAYYDFLARYYTTTDLRADAIHRIGLTEVARLRLAMEKLKLQTGFTGSLAEFFGHLRSDPKFFHKTPADLLAAYRAMSKRIDPELVKVFKTIPRQPYGVRAIPDNIAPDTTTAYYQQGAIDGTRPGYYYVNLYKPEVRPTWEMMALTLHEAVPGHHLQIARSQELADAPKVLKVSYVVAYVEGWALYAEQLGYDMGLYDDPYDRFGQLVYEMWRAVRLVVDTGMHAKGWSRDQAIAYFRENAAKTEQDIVNEIDRYIATPGQALAYKIGQMTISDLRAQAERELGSSFDLRDFNDAVLEAGAVPLPALTARLRAWITERRQR